MPANESGSQAPAPGGETRFTSTIGTTEASAGAVIGFYHLLEPIGQGGMGEVWLAQQKQPVRRRVALKLIKAGMDTREVVARFESERQALALMDHPAIAKVFDAGSTPQGRPYFVMEYVTGSPITDYCDKHKLDMRQRLELFMAVCDGVQHAHQKAILHRDLKPSNILVSEVDGKPAPRIIDFGVAKATAQRLTADTLYTRVGAMVGTPGYMSPEQADSAGANVDTRTDVYSLGVVLYELLVGGLPLDFRKSAPDEFLRRLREEDAPRPSTRFRTLGDQSATAAQNRGADVPTLARELRGDLDAITLKALEKDRARRYATPSELSVDIGRYLRHEPVVARPAGLAYRTRKYIRRHRLGVSVAALEAMLLLAAALAQTLELRRTRRERDRANRITEFMMKMFKVSDPSESRGNAVTAREILDKASRDVRTGLTKDPEVQAEMMYVMGDVYDNLGLYRQAHALTSDAYEIQRRTLGREHPQTVRSMNNLAWILQEEGRYAEAERLDREALDIRRRLLGSEHPATLSSASHLAIDLDNEGHYQEAERLYRETLALQRRLLGIDHPGTLTAMNNLGWNLHMQGRYAEAEKLHREVLEIQGRVLGRENMETLRTMNNVAWDLGDQGHYVESEKVYRETLELRRRVLGSDHPETILSIGNLAEVLLKQSEFDEAETLLREIVDSNRRAHGPRHPDTALATYNLACALALKGNRKEAFLLLREAVDHGLSVDRDLNFEKDEDLKSLRGDPQFAALVEHAKEQAATAQKPE